MRPPKVSAALLRERRGVSANDFVVIADSGPIPRHPTGIIANALPEFWAALRPDGSIWLMRRPSESGDDSCLAVMPADVVTAIQASRVPVVLQEAK